MKTETSDTAPPFTAAVNVKTAVHIVNSPTSPYRNNTQPMQLPRPATPPALMPPATADGADRSVAGSKAEPIRVAKRTYKKTLSVPRWA
ncbi:hypothetical protein ACWGGS_04925 [Streptomyces decoyicus]